MATIKPGTALDQPSRDRLDALIALIRGAVQQLHATALLMEEPQDARYVRQRINEANRIVANLLTVRDGQPSGQLVEWAREHFPRTYEMGAGMAVADLKAQAIVPVVGDPRIHTRAVEALIDRYLTDATEIVVRLHLNTVRASRVLLAQAGFGEQIAAGIIGGLPRTEVSRALKAEMRSAVAGTLPKNAQWSPADLTHVEINGRRYRLDTWAEMHARTETARASTAGTRVLSSVNGVGHVQITSHAHAPCICTPFEGRIYALRQGDPRFPWIGSVPGGGCPIHVNCVHREAPAVVDYLEERGEIDGRDAVPADFVGLSDKELARLVRANREQLRRYSEDRDGMLPQDFRLKEAA
jgi:hypothetical protein